MPEAPVAPTGSADVSSAPSFENEVAEFMGDYTGSSGGEPPEPDSPSAAGTTPAEPAAGTATETPPATAPAGDGTDKTPSEGTTPTAALTATEDDPFKDTTAATYMVNGQPRTSEDIRVFKEGGAVIRPEALPNILSQLAERATLAERTQSQQQQYQTLAKVSEWTDSSSGKTYTGPEAAIEMRIGNVALLAENTLLVENIIRSEDLESLLTTKQVADGKGGLREVVIFRPEVISDLQRENGLQQREIAAKIREHFAGVIAESSKPQATPINFEAATPELVKQIASGAKLDASHLTADDRKLLADLLPEHTKDGLASLKWQNLAKSMMRDRAQQKTSSASLVSATEKATKEGQARMAAAARGVKPVTKPVVAPTRQPSPETTRAQNEGDLFEAQERASANAMRRATA